MPSRKPIRMKKPRVAGKNRRASSAGRAKKRPDAARWWASPAAITAGIVVAVGAAMIVAGYAAGPAPTNVDAQNATAAERVDAQHPGIAQPPSKTPREIVAPKPAAAHVDESPANAASDDSSPTSAEPVAPPVTITGCLEQDADVFRLKDASGDAVPKARSWKSGFLKKHAPSIEVVDSANRLPRHVGERVSVTGILVDRTMTVRSFRSVAASCGAATKTKA